QSSYGREAAGVFAAAVAEAMRPGASVTSVVDAAVDVAHDGTRQAIEAVADAASSVTDWRGSLATLRAAVEPFDTVGPHYRSPAADARRPSRTKSIEELPVALGMMLVARGDYTESVLGAINYGRDSDSIATMAGAITGALGGLAVVRDEWVDDVATASRTDIVTPGLTMADVATEIWKRDAERQRDRADARSSYR
ncbi:MAG: ADP-ribosylglycohydrolase family protein, partial [Actinomycetota bacterium]|nr:ADP-ribosylglycohydrolase family protein [Actinomycetota bacterium]